MPSFPPITPIKEEKYPSREKPPIIPSSNPIKLSQLGKVVVLDVRADVEMAVSVREDVIVGEVVGAVLNLGGLADLRDRVVIKQ